MFSVCLLIFCGYFVCVAAFEKHRERESEREAARVSERKGQVGKIEISEILLLFFK